MSILRAITRYSIVFFLPLSCFASFWSLVLAGTGCTGTDSYLSSQMAICRFYSLYFIVDMIWNMVLAAIWVSSDEPKLLHSLLLRFVLLLAMFGLRVVAIGVMLNWRVEFRPYGL
jgi:hypothetical protein